MIAFFSDTLVKILSSLRHLVWFPLKALAVLFVCQVPGLALPQGGQVTQGSATIQQVNDTKLNINQSTDRAVINWSSFSIAPQEWVNFQQPSSTSATLNRVTGSTPSSIAGRLTANGQVFLVNPNGIAFLPTARVDVAGLVASTLNIQDTDFMQGILRFEQMPGKPPASVVNQGLITVKEAGFAALVAPAVQNSGIISARLGKVVLASGTTVSLDFYGDGLLSVTVDPNLAGQITDIYGHKLNSLIDNQGNITAPGGIVTLTAQAAGQIVDNVINTGGIIEAKYAENRNGVIVLSGGQKGTVAVNGTLDVSGVVSGEQGGKVTITGEKIALNGNALIDASGDQGGGIVNIGGSLQGKGTLQNAIETTVAKDVQIKADAITSGNGGEVIVWADGTTKFEGFVSAKGGIIAGDGGFIEISGKETLDLGTNWANQIQLSAPNGQFGTLLLDPNDITIVPGAVGTISTSPTNTNTLGAPDIAAFLGSGNLEIITSGTGGVGTITINSGVNITWSKATTLTLTADRNILMNAGAKIENTNPSTTFNAIVFNANTAGTTSGTFRAIELLDSKLISNGGNIKLTGISGNTGTGNTGIVMSGADAIVQSQNGSISLIGTGASTGGIGSGNRGISQESGAKVITTGGSITIDGTGAEAGIYFADTNSKISTTSGAISLTGKGGFGIYQQNTAAVTSTSGNITYTGTGTTAPGIVAIGTTTPIGGNTSGNIILNADTMQLNDATIQGTGTLTIQPITPSTTIGLGTGSGTLQLNNTELGTIQDGFKSITIGRTNGSGAITFGGYTFSDNLILQNPNGGGIAINGALSVGTNNLTLKSGGAVTQAEAITANGLELLGSGAYTLNNANNDISILAGNTTNNINYLDKNSLSVAFVNSTTGINTTGNITVTSGDTLTVEAGIDGITSTAGITTLTATNDILLGTASNFGDTRGQKLVLSAGQNIIIDNQSFVRSSGSGGIDLFAGGDFKISSAIAGDSRLESNGGGAPINIKVGGTFTLNTGTTNGIGANAGNITITADQMELISGTIGSSGLLLLQPLNTTTTIGIGTGAVGTLSLDTSEIGRLVNGFSSITIGRTDGTGNIDIRTAQFRDNVIIRTPAGTGTIDLKGDLSTGSGAQSGSITLLSGESIIGTNTGSITTQGKAVLLHSDFDATNGGAIKLTGTNITSNGGNITLGGGLNPFNNPAIGTSTLVRGIELNGAIFSAGAGNVSLRGTGFNTGSNNYGISVNGGNITTTNGNILLTGTGGTSDGSLNFGIFVQNGANISSTGTGNLTLIGTGGGSGSSLANNGIQLGDSHLSTGSGAILLDGTGGIGGQSHGIRQINGSSVTSSSGDITYVGRFINPDSQGILVQFDNSGVNNIIGNTSGTVTLTANRINLVGDLEIKPGSATSNLIIQPLNVNTSIAIGDGSGGGNLNLDSTALGFINDGFNLITIGRADGTGTINIGAATFKDNVLIQTPQGAGTINVNGLLASLDSNITLNAAQDIKFNSLSGIVSGTGNITLDAGRDISFNAISGIIDGTGDILLDAGRNIAFNNFSGGFDWKGNIAIIAGQDISFTDAILGTTENISLSAGGNATQTGNSTLLATGLELLGAGSYTLTNASNNITTLAANTTNALSYADINGFDIGVVNATHGITTNNNVTFNAGGTVTQSQTIIGNGIELLGTGAYTLTNPNNDINILAGNTTNNIKFTDTNGFDIGTVNGTDGVNVGANNLTLKAGDTVTQTTAITANGLALLGSGSFDLQNTGNTITTIAADTTNDISFVNSQTLTVGTVNPTGITTTGDVFLQALTGDLVLEAVNGQISAQNITLVAENDFINKVGAGALNAGGIFLVYATSPEPTGNFQGFSVLKGSQQFNTTYPDPALFKGNGFLYKSLAPIIPVLPSSSVFTEPVTFVLNFNDRQWRDLSDLGDTTLFPSSSLLCANVPVNQSSDSSTLNDPIIVRNENLPDIRTRWQTGELPQCSSPDD